MLRPFVFLAALAAVPAQAMDRETSQALKTCHDYLWEVPDYKDLPNAAISVWPHSTENGNTIVFWAVRWDNKRAAGECTIRGDKVEGFEDYTKHSG